jgi:hypothetical protein
MATYPNTTGFVYSFERGEITMNGRSWRVKSVDVDQPTEEGQLEGNASTPGGRTTGSMKLGEGTVEFSTEADRADFITALGNAYREKIWGLTWVLRAPGSPDVRNECIGCRLLSEPISHKSGTDALTGEIKFSFLQKKFNGLLPHST